MTETSKLIPIRVLTLLASAALACSVDAGGQIPCADDFSCPNDYPVCASGKCIAGTSTAKVSVAIVGVSGKTAGAPVRGIVDVQVSARSTSGIKSVSLTGGGKTFAAAAGSTGPIYDFSVDTTTVADGAVSFTATVTPGDDSVQPVSSTAFAINVDNTPPVLTSSATIPPVALGSQVTLDVTASEAVQALSADVLFSGDPIGQAIEVAAPTGNVHHLGFAVVSSAPDGAYAFSVTATDLAGNATTTALTKPFSVVPDPTSNVSADNSNVTSGDAVVLTAGFTNGTAAISASPLDGTLPATLTPNQQVTVHPSLDTVYTLAVTNPAGVTRSSQVKVFVSQSVPVALSAPGSATSPGDAVNLTANVGSNAKQAILEPGDIAVTADATNHSVPVSPDATTTYTLIATNAAGREYRTTATVTVTQPQMMSFTGPDQVTSNSGGIVLTAQFAPYSASPGAPSATASIAVPGAPSTFCTPGTVSGNAGVGTQAFGCPQIGADTTYTVDLQLGTKTIHANLTVLAAPAPTIESFVATPPLLPFSPLPAPLGSGTIGLISQYCATANPPLPPTFRCSATVSANGGSPVNQPHSGTPPTAAQLLAPSATTNYTLLVTNTAGATGSAQITVPVFQGTVASNVMGSAHIGAVSALLPNGKVLVAGGSTDGTRANATAYAELFDPKTGTWSPVGCGCAGTSSCGGDGTPAATLQVPRFQAGAASLADGTGTVLITGGANATNTALTSTEVYDTATDCFRAGTHDLNTARTNHTATAYGSGDAVVIGGTGLKSCEVYAPGNAVNHGTFTACTGTNKDMQVNRAGHVAILLATRYVVVAGGAAADRSADIYDTATNGVSGFTALSSTVMQVGRTAATATLLTNGKVLIAGGGSGTAELFTFVAGSPPSGSTAPTSTPMSVTRTGHAAIPLNGGGVLMVGGNASATVDAYDPVANVFGTTFSLGTSRPNGTFGLPLLFEGRALVGGGTTTATAADYVVP